MNPSGKATDGLTVVPDGGTITLSEYKRLRKTARKVHVVKPQLHGGGGDAA